MKKYLVFLLLAALAVSCSKPAPATETVTQPVEVTVEEKTALPEPDTLEERFAYVYGYQLLNSIIAQMPELDSAYFAEGVRAYVDNDFSYTMAESQEIMKEYQQKRYESYEAEMNVLREKNLAAAESFLSTNSKRSGVKAYSDKLQYEVLREPQEGGKKAQANSTVTVNYQLITLSGEVKDSSYERGQTSTFDLSTNIIEGFRAACSVMSEGEKIRAWVHPDLGYGINGSSNIEPNQLLIFDIELISVDK